MRIKIQKNKKATLIVKERLILEQWLKGDGCASLILDANAKCLIEKEFTLGQGVNIYVGSNAQLIMKGKNNESASGITANSVIMVNDYLEIGEDCIIAWDTFITDCDWHGLEGKNRQRKP